MGWPLAQKVSYLFHLCSKSAVTVALHPSLID